MADERARAAPDWNAAHYQIIDTRTHVAVPREASEEMVEAVARAIAPMIGAPWEQMLADKAEWIERRGMDYSDHFTDVNEPRKADCLEAARAALAAVRAFAAKEG